MAVLEIDRAAPVCASLDIRILAPVELVWSVLTDFRDWPAWNPDVSRMNVRGPLAPGSQFRWRGGGISIVSTVQEVENSRRICWTGKTVGTRAIHVWRFAASGSETVVYTEESFDGWLPRLMTGRMRKLLKTSLARGLAYLKEECERRPITSAAQLDPAEKSS